MKGGRQSDGVNVWMEAERNREVGGGRERDREGDKYSWVEAQRERQLVIEMQRKSKLSNVFFLSFFVHSVLTSVSSLCNKSHREILSYNCL